MYRSNARNNAVHWVESSGKVDELTASDMTGDWLSAFDSSGTNIDIILDRLPGRFAPDMARAAIRLNLIM